MTVGQEAQIITAVFPSPAVVMQVFLQRVFAQVVRPLLLVSCDDAADDQAVDSSLRRSTHLYRFFLLDTRLSQSPRPRSFLNLQARRGPEIARLLPRLLNLFVDRDRRHLHVRPELNSHRWND